MNGIELTPEHPVSALAEYGALAADAGFDTIFASSHYNNRDPFVALDRIGQATSEIRLGPGVVNPYETHPVALASRVATLDEATGGRAVFGLGAGDRSTLRNLGYDRDRPLRRVLEAMKVSQQLWAGERVNHDGTFVAKDAALNFDVGRIPVYVGAQGPHMLKMSAKHADGVLINASHPADVEWAADQLAEGLELRPEGRGEFDAAVYASVSIAPDREAAREAARPPVAFIAGGAAPPVLERHGIDPAVASRIGDQIGAGDFRGAFGAVTEEMIDAFCIAGTPEEVEEKVAGVRAHVDSIVMGAPLGPDVETAISLAGAVLA